MRRLINRHGTNILAVSEGSMISCWGPDWSDDNRCQVVYNGIDLTRFNLDNTTTDVRKEFGIESHSPLVIHVGSYRKEKNHPKLISVFAEFLKLQPEARLLLVGSGNESAELQIKQCIANNGLGDEVILCGSRNDVPRLLLASDIMLFPSILEGLPGGVLEAAVAGLPVLATDLPGVLEIAKRFDQVHSLPLSHTDSMWAMKLQKIFVESGEVRGDGLKLKESDDFSIEKMVNQLQDVWNG